MLFGSEHKIVIVERFFFDSQSLAGRRNPLPCSNGSDSSSVGLFEHEKQKFDKTETY